MDNLETLATLGTTRHGKMSQKTQKHNK